MAKLTKADFDKVILEVLEPEPIKRLPTQGRPEVLERLKQVAQTRRIKGI